MASKDHPRIKITVTVHPDCQLTEERMRILLEAVREQLSKKDPTPSPA